MQNKNIEDLTHELLKQIGENPLREGLVRTPSRVAKAWEFFSKGYNQDIHSIINNAIFNEEAKDMVVVLDVEFFSLCEHHLLPFFGRAHVAYLPTPEGKVIGLSKLNRIVEFYARRPQVQENLTMQIHSHINKVCEQNIGTAVMLEANHMCACVRGVKHDATMKTAKLSGVFKKTVRAKEEFYDFIRDLK